MAKLTARQQARSKVLTNKLPNLPVQDSEKNAVDYVSMVYEGLDKVEAFKRVFPKQYSDACIFAEVNNRNEKDIVMSKISVYEKGKYVTKLYQLGREDYWKKFIHKKTRLLDKAYDMAMDDEKGDRIQLLAMKTFLDNVPDMKEDINVNVKHHISADTEFLNKIQARKEALLNLNDDAIDVEVEENGL